MISSYFPRIWGSFLNFLNNPVSLAKHKSLEGNSLWPTFQGKGTEYWVPVKEILSIDCAWTSFPDSKTFQTSQLQDLFFEMFPVLLCGVNNKIKISIWGEHTLQGTRQISTQGSLNSYRITRPPLILFPSWISHKKFEPTKISSFLETSGKLMWFKWAYS